LRTTLRDVAEGPQHIYGAAEVEETQSNSGLCGKRLLIADDELNIRKTIGDVLTKLGCHCTICKDGYEAVNILEQQSFDLIVSDIKMPHRNGYEIFAAANRLHPGLPVILMTGFGYDPNHSIVRASREGLSTVLFKPFKVDQLLDEVYKALGIVRPEKPSDDPAAESTPSQAKQTS